MNAKAWRGYQENDLVRLKKEVQPKGRRATARVVGFLHDVPGGVQLDNKLLGFNCWNVADLERLPK